MTVQYPKAEKYVSDLLQELCPSAQIEMLPNNTAPGIINYHLEFDSDQPSKTISFSRDLLDDLEEAFKRNGTSTHDEALKSRARFTAFISLGKSGLLPRDFSISKFIVSERGDWSSSLSVSTHYEAKLTKDLLEGLEKLHGYLQKHLLENQDLEKGLESLSRGRDRIAEILNYYKKNETLNSNGVSTETLMYFKAAIAAQIIDKETRRSKAAMTLIKGAIEREIYDLVEILREDFLNVPLPQWFSEYSEVASVSQQDISPNIGQTLTEEAFVIMQIGNEQMDSIFERVYEPAIKACGLIPRRVDRHNEGRMLQSEIADFVRRSKIIIADLTNERPNCYLEVGYAMGVKKFSNLILCARADHHHEHPAYEKGGPKIHFDLAGYDFIWWEEVKKDGLHHFKKELIVTIERRLKIINRPIKA